MRSDAVKCLMTWTYTAGLLSLSTTTASLMKVRFMSGDTDTTRQQLTDEEIYGVLTYQTSPTLAAATACDALAAKYSFLCNVENGSLRISAAARMKHYQDLADRLRAGGAGDVPGDPNITEATMSVGGTSVSAKDTLASNSDNIGTPFRLGQDDMPGLSSGTSSFSV